MPVRACGVFGALISRESLENAGRYSPIKGICFEIFSHGAKFPVSDEKDLPPRVPIGEFRLTR